MNTIKDGYLKAVDWIAAHPHKTLGYSVAAIVVVMAISLL